MVSLLNKYELLKIYISNKDYKLFNTEKSIYIDNIKISIYEYLLKIKGFKEIKFFKRNLKELNLRNIYIINKEKYDKFKDFNDFINKLENTNIYLGNNYLFYDEIKEIFQKIEENKTKSIYNKLDNYYKSLLLIIENSYYKDDNNETMNIIRCKINILSNLLELVGNKINERYNKFFNKNITIIKIENFLEKIEDTENDNKLFYEKINKILNNIKIPKIREIII
jgi:hypothetical protein